MRSFFYPKLAVTNIKKNAKLYVPYLLTGIITVAMNYIIQSMSFNKGLQEMPGTKDVVLCLNIGIMIVAIFSCIFLFYTNSFLMKNRKKELGLYNVLGLGKRHLAKMMFCETFFIALVDIVAGIVGGMIFSKLLFLILYRLVALDAPLEFAIEPQAVVMTVLLFGIIFTACTLYNFWQVWRVNTIELLRGGNMGEREPKTKVLLTLIGVLTLGAGYAIALRIEQPLEALLFFFVAVLLVIIGTYCLFTAGSIFLLKLFRKNKKYYYKTNHFISVSGMIYRMKQNAVGLANICILSTMVLVMVSTTVSLYVGIDDIMMKRYPYEFSMTGYEMSEEELSAYRETVQAEAKKAGVPIKRENCYRDMSMVVEQSGDNEMRIFEAENRGVASGTKFLTLMPVKYYNLLSGEKVVLDETEALVYIPKKTKGIHLDSGEMQLNDWKFQIRLLDRWFDSGEDEEMPMDTVMLVVPDGAMEQIYAKAMEENLAVNPIRSAYGADFDADEETKKALTDRLRDYFEEVDYTGYAETREANYSSFLAFCGGFLFLGIFFGILFLMATVLIIYYKQISEGYDDRERFQIMQKVGMSEGEVKKAIRSQVISVFALPLVVAVLHIAVAFKVITKLLALFNMTNVALFGTCTLITVLVFAAIYIVVYGVTAKEYYRIVR